MRHPNSPPLSDLTFYQGRHGRFAHFRSDICVGMSLLYYGEWGEDEIAVLRPYVRPGSTVLDVGANVGTHTIPFAKMVGDDGVVLSIDAQPEVFGLLCTNVINSGMAHRIRPVQMLVGDREAIVPYYGTMGEENRGARSFVNEVRGSPQPGLFHLPMATLDSLPVMDCSLMKIDVEGLELQVLSSAQNLLARDKPAVYFEHAAGDVGVMRQLHDLLRGLGYRLFWHVANPYNANNFRNEPVNVFGGAVEVNVLCTAGEAPHGLEEVTDPTVPPELPTAEVRMRGAAVPDFEPVRHLSPIDPETRREIEERVQSFLRPQAA